MEVAFELLPLLVENGASFWLQECKCNGGFQLEMNTVSNKLSCVRMASVNRTVNPAILVSESC